MNGAEVAGSQSTVIPAHADGITTPATPVSKSFIATFATGDVLRIQFACSTLVGQLPAGIGMGTTRPSASITIIKIQ